MHPIGGGVGEGGNNNTNINNDNNNNNNNVDNNITNIKSNDNENNGVDGIATNSNYYNVHDGRSSLERTRSQYQRKLERQRQLEMMEAAASGTAPSMQLITTPNSTSSYSTAPSPDFLSGNGSMNMNNAASTKGIAAVATTTAASGQFDINHGLRSRETARRFLHDEDDDDAAAATNTNVNQIHSNTPTVGIAAKELFGRPREYDYNSGQMNLMDHDTAVYKQSTSSSLGQRISNFLIPARTGTEQDGIILSDDGYRFPNNSDYHRRSTATKEKRGNHPLLYVLLSFALFAVVYFVLVHPHLKNDENSNDSEYTGIVDHMKGILPGLHSHAESEQILRDENSKRFNTIFDVLIQDGSTPTKAFLHYEGPEYMALRWVSYTDPAKLDPSSVVPSEIVQRYAMAVLYFDSYIEFQEHYGKQSSIGNMTDTTEQTIGVPNPGWTRKDYWMTEKGICMWYGVHCEEKIVDNKRMTQYNENGNVIKIALPNNNVYGSLPRELIAFDNLLTIDFSNNKLRGQFPIHMGRLFKLQFLYLEHNDLSGQIPDDIGNLEGLIELYMGNNHLNASIPSTMDRLYNLQTLSMDHNELSGKIPDLSSIKGLYNLWLHNNKLNGFFPFELALLTSLYQLHVNDNEFTGTIPPELGNSIHLLSLHLENNHLDGTIPNFLFQYLNDIKEIHLDNNRLSGSIPETVDALINIRTLSLHHNVLNSTIPSTIGGMKNLNKLHLYNNQLSGSVPSEIGDVSALQEFWANDNKLNGVLPSEVGKCRQLETIYLEHNTFVDTIPAEIGGIDGLKSFRIFDNYIMDTSMPDSICVNRNEQFSSLKYIAADCTDKIKCSCCDKCY
jgi:Leucine-rich repeat (LRR) protein